MLNHQVRIAFSCGFFFLHRSVALGYQAIKLGEADVVVCGGQESMTQAHHAVKLRQKTMGNVDMVDTMLIDGLVDAFHNCHMGITGN